MEALKHEKIIVSYREGGVRVSPHFYNSDEEVDRLIAVLKRKA
jgi:selenocysteine lyase/cysteine desulfurase